MAHLARLDENNKVIEIISIHNDYDDIAEDFAKELYGGLWIKTSYNAKIRGKFAGVGDTYDENEDIFIAPQPFPSWLRNGSYWQAPTPLPLDGKFYQWDEDSLAWVKIGN